MESNKLFFSVIIPTLNEEHFVLHLLTNLKDQETKNFDVIIVDGKSQDRTLEVVNEFSKYYSIQVIVNEKRNVAYQRNSGAERAKGEYLIFLDADTTIQKNFTQKLYDEIKKSNKDLYIPSLNTQEGETKFKRLFAFFNSIAYVYEKIHKALCLGGNMILRRSFFEKIHGFNVEYTISEDVEIGVRAVKKGGSFKILRDITVEFSMRRVKNEGMFSTGLKYILASGKNIFFGAGMKKPPFKYEMGGKVN